MEELKARAEKIKNQLKPWAGMLLTEARACGWGDEQDRLQAELWWIGYLLKDRHGGRNEKI